MRIGDSIWHSKRISPTDAEIKEYSEPTEIITRLNYFTVMPAQSRGGLMEVLKWGEKINDMWIAVANSRCFAGEIKVGDLFWLDGEMPIPEKEEMYGYGSTANAKVLSIANNNLNITIYLGSNQERVTE